MLDKQRFVSWLGQIFSNELTRGKHSIILTSV
jgi:hypothetical protein